MIITPLAVTQSLHMIQSSLNKIIYNHGQISLEKGQEPRRLVNVWVRTLQFPSTAERSHGVTASLVVTAFDLYRSLFGDCAYSMFSEMKGARPMNVFQISSIQYRDLTQCIKKYLSVKRCSARFAFRRSLTSKGLEFLSELAYEITVSRVWAVKHRSLDPVYNPYCPPPFSEVGTEALVHSQILLTYLIKDVVGIILMYSIDPCLPNHLRCSKENTSERPTPQSEATPPGLRVAEGSGAGGLNEVNGTRCNRLRLVPGGSCADHRNNPYQLSNHYFVD